METFLTQWWGRGVNQGLGEDYLLSPDNKYPMQADMVGYITPVFNYPKTGPFSHNGLLVAVTKCHKDVQKVPSNFIACSKKPKQNDVLPAGRNWHRKPIFMWFFYFFINIAYEFFFLECLQVSFLFWLLVYSYVLSEIYFKMCDNHRQM